MLFPGGNPFLAYFSLSGAADVLWALLRGRDVVCYQVSACVAPLFSFLLLHFVEQMVLVPMAALDSAEISYLMPLLYDGNSLWSVWRRECTVDYCLLFMSFKILLGLYFFLLSSSNPLTTCPKIFGLKLPATWGILLFIMVVSSIILHSYRYLPTTCLPL